MNKIIKQESAISLFGIYARQFGIVADDTNGRILNQKIKATRTYSENGKTYRITVCLRFDDECRNGHETFSITADIRENGREYMGGCCHDEVALRFPELAHLIKWHLVSTDGPLHYLANTMYHAANGSLAYARSSAVWPDATIEQLRDKAALMARLPGLMSEFHLEMMRCGFVWPQHAAETAATVSEAA